LTSANSINIARLMPQMFYFAAAWGRLHEENRGLVFVIPSGNLGNLTGGLMAAAMGVPVERFVAATNVNDVVVEYLRTGSFRPRPSVRSISNAMDVGDPGNLARIRALLEDDIEAMRSRIHAESCTDEETRGAMKEAFQGHRYLFDPHGAVGYRAARRYIDRSGSGARAVVLATAHPAKFPEALDDELRSDVEVPSALRGLADKPKKMTPVHADYDEFRQILTRSVR
ncbi:MAG: pyridoxal-phosphate dependent enzyme, partial [Bacteroidetes bacterium]|nr:pyridoxal-phosphate dependent enzyme [Bacteroidota bacterium]